VRSHHRQFQLISWARDSIRSSSLPAVSSPVEDSNIQRCATTEANFHDVSSNKEKNANPKKKSVSWSNDIMVVLIPSLEEYRERKMFDELWYEKEDFVIFQAAAVAEVKAVMDRKNVVMEEAMDLLYQQDVSELIGEEKCIDDTTSISRLDSFSEGLFVDE
jgi:hypothetical protein